MSRYTGGKGKRAGQKKRQQTETVAESVHFFMATVLDLMVCFYMLMILVVMPFFYRDGFTRIGTDKAYFFQQCNRYAYWCLFPVLVLYLVAGAVVFVQKKGFSAIRTWRPKWSATDSFALAYGISLILSYLCSDYKREAWMGADGWFMGFVPQLTLVGIYFVVSRTWKKKDVIVGAILPVSAVVFLLGILNRFAVYPIDMKLENPYFISTIGNINWYCGYLTTVFFAGLVFFWQTDHNQPWWKLLLALYTAIGSVALVTQGSSSGLVAAAVVLFVMFGLSAGDQQRMQAFWEVVTVFSVSCLILWLVQALGWAQVNFRDAAVTLFTDGTTAVVMTIMSFVVLACVTYTKKTGTYPERFFRRLSRIAIAAAITGVALSALLITVNTASGGRISQAMGLPAENPLMLSSNWGSNRGVTWKAAVMCFEQQDFLHKLVGTGPDCMAAFLYNGGSEELIAMVKEVFGASRLTNAHNEWLTLLVDVGLLGCISFVGMMGTAAVRFLKAGIVLKAGNQGGRAGMILLACGFCVLAYTANNVFSFQQSMNVSTMFVILGIGENYLRAGQTTVTKGGKAK